MRDDLKGLVDQEAFEDTLRENQYYKSDLDREWLHNFISYYESSKHTPTAPEAGDERKYVLRRMTKAEYEAARCAIAALGKTGGAGELPDEEAIANAIGCSLLNAIYPSINHRSLAGLNKAIVMKVLEILRPYLRELKQQSTNLQSPKREDVWMDISTAPKDETIIDLWDKGLQVECWWSGERWVSYCSGILHKDDYINTIHNPTHWRHLPEPPKRNDMEGGE